MRALLTCQPIPGHLNPNRGLASALRERGHDVAFYSGESARKAIENDGYRFYPYEAEMDRHIMGYILPPEGVSAAGNLVDDEWALFQHRRVSAVLEDWFLRTIPQQILDLEQIISDFKPDVIINDVTLMGPTLVMKELSSVPVVVFSVIPACPIPGPEVPPWGRGLARSKGPLGSVKRRIQRTISDWIISGYKESVNRLRKKYGLPALRGRVADEYANVPMFLVSGTPSLDYNRTDLPPNVHYVGACTSAIRHTGAIPDWLKELPRNQPVVYVTEGTVHVAEPLTLRSAAAGLRDMALQVILSTGDHRKPAELNLGPIASNIRVEQYIPHEPLFERIDLLVTTGGAGTIAKALLAGVPILIIPVGWEHAENAERIVEAGVGLRLEPRNCTPENLRRSVEQILENSSFRENARRVGAEMAQQGGATHAARLLEQLLGSEPIIPVSFDTSGNIS